MRPWLISAVLLAAPPAPTPEARELGNDVVALDLSELGADELGMDEAALHRFHGELILRLLEAGHAVGPGGSVQLSLVSAGEAVAVECVGAARRARVEVETADAPILALELVHRAVDLVGGCTAPQELAVIDDALVIDGSGLSDVELSALALDLTEASMTLVAQEEAASWRLCVTEGELGGGAVIVAIEHGCEATLAVAPLLPSAREAVDAWRARGSEAEAETETETETETEAEAEAEAEPSTPRPPRRRAVWAPSFGAAGGVALGLPGVAATLRADLSAVHSSRLLLGVVGVVAPARRERLTLVDASVLASLGYRGIVSERVILRPSVGVGLGIHRFAYPGEAVGHRLDLALRIPLELQLRVAPRTFVSFAVAGSFGTRRVVHQLVDSTIAVHSIVRIEALIGLRFDALARID